MYNEALSLIEGNAPKYQTILFYPTLNFMNTLQRQAGLDVFRSIAILVVVLGHGLPLLQAANTAFPYIPLPDGVEMFFVLSGFLIGQILLRVPVFDTKNLLHFWSRRWLRTLPAYYVILILNIVLSKVHLIGASPEAITWHFWVFTQNLAWPFQGFFWESWSLAVEEWFYLLFPLIACLLTYSLRLSSRQAFVFVLCLFFIVPLGLRYWYFQQLESLDDFQYDISFRKVVLLRLDAIAFGLLMAYLKVTFEKAFYQYRYALLVLALGLQYYLWHLDLPTYSAGLTVWRFSLLGITYACALPFIDSLRKVPLQGFFTFTSKISYSLYLTNLLWVELITTSFPPSNYTALHAVLIYGGYWLITYGSSYLLYRYIEQPVMKWRDKRFA